MDQDFELVCDDGHICVVSRAGEGCMFDPGTVCALRPDPETGLCDVLEWPIRSKEWQRQPGVIMHPDDFDRLMRWWDENKREFLH